MEDAFYNGGFRMLFCFGGECKPRYYSPEADPWQTRFRLALPSFVTGDIYENAAQCIHRATRLWLAAEGVNVYRA